MRILQWKINDIIQITISISQNVNYFYRPIAK